MTDSQALHVTFDRDVASRILRRSRKPVAASTDVYTRLLEAIHSHSIRPYVSEATLNFELFSKEDRLLILASQFAYGTIRPEMPPAPPQAQAWVDDLVSLGFRILRSVPRIGLTAWACVGSAWAEDMRYPIRERQDRQRALAERFDHLAQPRLRAWGEELARAHELDNTPLCRQPYSRLPGLLWFNGLSAEAQYQRLCRSRADFLSKLRTIFSDWFDLDAIASHYGYGLNYFCTGEVEKSGRPNETIHDCENRRALVTDFGVRVVSAHELSISTENLTRR